MLMPSFKVYSLNGGQIALEVLTLSDPFSKLKEFSIMVLDFNSAIAKINRAMATIKLKFDYSLQDFLSNFKKHEYSNDVEEVTVELFDTTKIDHFYSQVNEIIRVAL